MDTLLKFGKIRGSIRRVVGKYSIIKSRIINFLIFLFPSMTKWTQIVHMKSDADSNKKWKDECANLKSLVILMKSGQFTVGGFHREFEWTENSIEFYQNAFLFSLNKKKMPV